MSIVRKNRNPSDIIEHVIISFQITLCDIDASYNQTAAISLLHVLPSIFLLSKDVYNCHFLENICHNYCANIGRGGGGDVSTHRDSLLGVHLS